MTGEEFVLFVKAKLNRLDSGAYEDVKPEEILFFGHQALKSLTLSFDLYKFSETSDKANLNVYLASVTKISPEIAVVNSKLSLPLVLKIKDLRAYVEVPITSEEGWAPTRELTNDRTFTRESNPFEKSFADKPAYRMIENSIEFDKSPVFTVSKVIMEYLEYPEELTEQSVMEYPFVEDLQNMTTTLILENLESKRIATQPTLSRA